MPGSYNNHELATKRAYHELVGNKEGVNGLPDSSTTSHPSNGENDTASSRMYL